MSAIAASTALAGPYASPELTVRVASWWRARAYAVGVDPVAAGVGLGIDLEFGDPSMDAYPSGYALGDAYTASLTASERGAHGRHYTPELLSDELWSQLRTADAELAATATVADPASGAGALLLPAVRAAVTEELAVATPSADASPALTGLASRFGGRDLDPVAVWLGNVVLAAELLPLWARSHTRAPLPHLLRVGDGLAPTALSEITVLNPPYGRVRLDDADRARWAHVLSGHSNRYALFLAAAIASTQPGGLIGAVVPTSFTGGAYYRRLRSYLTAHAPLHRLVFVTDRSNVFAGVLQETCLAVFRRSASPGQVRCSRLTVNGKVQRADLGVSVLAHKPEPVRSDQLALSVADCQETPSPELPWLLPREPSDAALVRRAAELPLRLSDYGWKVSTGPLVWNRHRPQLSDRDGDDRVRIVWAADLESGTLNQHPSRDQHRFVTLRKRDQFMRLAEPAVLIQRTTAPEQQRRLLAAVLDTHVLVAWGGTVVVENHVNVLRRTDATDVAGELTPRVLTALLDSEALDRLYRCLTGSVAVSAYELHSLPLPDAEVVTGWERLSGEDLREEIENYYA